MDVFRIKLFFIVMVNVLFLMNSFIEILCLGVDDGHFQKVLDNEVRALQNACKGKSLNEV
jgi:hypothetical protein